MQFDVRITVNMTADPVDLSSVIGDIYDAAIEPSLWTGALGSICRFVGGSSATLFWHDSATLRSEALHLYNDDPHYTRLYFEKYLPMNPVFPAATFMATGVVVGVNDIIPQSELERTRFYKEWIKPQGIVDVLAVNLEKGTARSSLLNVQSHEHSGILDEGARQRLSLLVPHVQRAVAIGRLFDQSKLTETALATTLDHIEAAVLLVGADGTVTFANEIAKAMLDQATIICAANNLLHIASSETDQVLYDLLKSAEKGDDSIGVRGVALPLPAPSNDRWFAHLLPLTSGNRRQAGLAYAAVAAIFIRKSAPNAPPPLETIAKVYKLTASEVRVLSAILNSQAIKSTAEALGVSQATVKTHLHNLFRKTGTHNQRQLAKLVGVI